MIFSKIICLVCKREFTLKIKDVCWPCCAGSVGKYDITKSAFGYHSKLFAYHCLLYIPIAVFIGLHFGFFFEISWIMGGIYLLIIPTIRDWLARKF
jgi:hypothetical protein